MGNKKKLPRKCVCVLPVYNEQKTLADILQRVWRYVDILVCINDGSNDQSLSLLTEFVATHSNVYLVNLEKNQGMAGALKAGFLFIEYLNKKKYIGPDDIVITMDADGQHYPESIPGACQYFLKNKLDILLAQRDFSLYPKYKIIGNKFLSFTNSILSGYTYHDVESGFRLLKVKTLKPILAYYTGIRYSCAQEIALISARLKYKVDNNYRINIAYYRPGTTVVDGLIVLSISGLTWIRLLLKKGMIVDTADQLMRKNFNKSISLRKTNYT